MTDETAKRQVVVFHTTYGCDTGCCGHVIQLGNEEQFVFDHPYGINSTDAAALRAYAEELVRDAYGEEHVADLDWENCFVTDSC